MIVFLIQRPVRKINEEAKIFLALLKSTNNTRIREGNSLARFPFLVLRKTFI